MSRESDGLFRLLGTAATIAAMNADLPLGNDETTLAMGRAIVRALGRVDGGRCDCRLYDTACVLGLDSPNMHPGPNCPMSKP